MTRRCKTPIRSLAPPQVGATLPPAHYTQLHRPQEQEAAGTSYLEAELDKRIQRMRYLLAGCGCAGLVGVLFLLVAEGTRYVTPRPQPPSPSPGTPLPPDRRISGSSLADTPERVTRPSACSVTAWRRERNARGQHRCLTSPTPTLGGLFRAAPRSDSSSPRCS